MNATRKYLRNMPAVALLVLAVLLRSLIAPGLVVENDKDYPLGFQLAYCDDLIPSRITDNSSAHATGHVDPGHVYDIIGVSGSPDTHTGNGHDHSRGYGLSEGHCGLWSASGIFLADISWQFSRQFEVQSAVQLRPDYDGVFSRADLISDAQPRAPPLS